MPKFTKKILLKEERTITNTTTGSAGYVYFKVNAPTKTVVAGESVTNTDTWSYGLASPSKWQYFLSYNTIDFSFNKVVEAADAVAAGLSITVNGTDYPVVEKTAEMTGDATKGWNNVQVGQLFFNDGWNHDLWVSATGERATLSNADEGTLVKYYIDADGNFLEFTLEESAGRPAQDAEFKYAGNGTYTTTFYNTSRDGDTLKKYTTRTITVKNNQNEVKYLGLNPEFKGVTEINISAANLEDIIREQLRFSYEDLFLGAYYEGADAFSGYGISLDLARTLANNNVKFDSDNSVYINKLYFTVALDTPDTVTEDYTYTSVVNVGARIKAK